MKVKDDQGHTGDRERKREIEEEKGYSGWTFHMTH